MNFHSVISWTLLLPLLFFYYGPFKKQQNLILLATSLLLYGLVDWRFIPVLVISTVIAYFSAIRIEAETDTSKKLKLLSVSIGAEVLLLTFFKFQSFLPILGISFYTFQAIGYLADVYSGLVPACKQPVNFFAFKSYFPVIQAGPIERAKNLLHQLTTPRQWQIENFADGSALILRGAIKKFLIGDSLAALVDPLFSQAGTLNRLNIWFMAVAFCFQIYADFSGYTDIARGTSKFFGINLIENFNRPFFSRNIVEFWQRWHMSLSNWFRDYVFYPLSLKTRNIYLSVFITFVLIGVWHDPKWNFLIMGIYNGLCIAAYIALSSLFKRKFKNSARLHKIGEIANAVLLFHYVALNFLIFRSESVSQLQHTVLDGVIRGTNTGIQLLAPQWNSFVIYAALLLAFDFLEISVLPKQQQSNLHRKWPAFGASFYFYLFLLIIAFTKRPEGNDIQFIYFQF